MNCASFEKAQKAQKAKWKRLLISVDNFRNWLSSHVLSLRYFLEGEKARGGREFNKEFRTNLVRLRSS